MYFIYFQCELTDYSLEKGVFTISNSTAQQPTTSLHEGNLSSNLYLNLKKKLLKK